MTDHKIGTREEWLAARLELLKAEKELTRRSDELAQWRLRLPWVRIDKDYHFETDEGMASLADLFRGRSQLLIYHFMFGPEYRGGCPACSAIADGFNGFAVHLEHHDVGMIAVSRAPIAALHRAQLPVQLFFRGFLRRDVERGVNAQLLAIHILTDPLLDFLAHDLREVGAQRALPMEARRIARGTEPQLFGRVGALLRDETLLRHHREHEVAPLPRALRLVA